MKLASTLLVVFLSEQAIIFWIPGYSKIAHRNMLPAPNTAWKTRCYCAHGAWRLAEHNELGTPISIWHAGNPSFPQKMQQSQPQPPPGALHLQAQILRLRNSARGKTHDSFHARWLPRTECWPESHSTCPQTHQNTNPHESLADLPFQIIAPAPKINLPPFTPLRHAKIRTQVVTSRSGSRLRRHGLQFEVLVHGTRTTEAHQKRSNTKEEVQKRKRPHNYWYIFLFLHEGFRSSWPSTVTEASKMTTSSLKPLLRSILGDHSGQCGLS